MTQEYRINPHLDFEMWVPMLAVYTNSTAMRFPLALVLLCLAPAPAHTQQTAPLPSNQILTIRTTLVQVPALVKTKSGELVFSLAASDFALTDNGVPQQLTLEPDTDAEPLALAIVVETGGSGARHLADYRQLGPILDAVIGNIPHRVAVIGFGSKPTVLQNFTGSTEAAADTLDNLKPGDSGAAILDALAFAVDQLRQQSPSYRRAILLVSETIDSGSQTSLDDTLRAIGDTNTAIYTFGFSSTGPALSHEAARFNDSTPGPDKGCMSNAPGADPDAHGNRKLQAYDCASELLPPLRLARLAFIAARDGMRRNVPESVANLTGGEYFHFKDARSLQRGLFTISNDVPNHYVLYFRPQSPHPGLHALSMHMVDRPHLVLEFRSAYWVDSDSTAQTPR